MSVKCRLETCSIIGSSLAILYVLPHNLAVIAVCSRTCSEVLSAQLCVRIKQAQLIFTPSHPPPTLCVTKGC